MGRKKIKPELVTRNVDKLCEMVNEKYNLKQNSVGSIEYHNDATENSIVQICNEARGTKQLIYGDNTTLKKYLQNILNDTVALYSL